MKTHTPAYEPLPKLSFSGEAIDAFTTSLGYLTAEAAENRTGDTTAVGYSARLRLRNKTSIDVELVSVNDNTLTVWRLYGSRRSDQMSIIAFDDITTIYIY